jgi:hypothetical protein
MVVQSPRHLISQVLSPAVRFWLRSQVESVSELNFNLTGGNRQILTGYIPGVFLAAASAVYQGLHFTQIQLEAQNIRINLGQILKGQPLRLLEPIPVSGEVSLSQADLQASLVSPLLSTAIQDLLSTLMAASGGSTEIPGFLAWPMTWQTAEITPDGLKLTGIVTNVDKKTIPIVLETQLDLANCHCLRLSNTRITATPEFEPIHWARFEIDLGEEVNLEAIRFAPNQMIVCGGVKVMP